MSEHANEEQPTGTTEVTTDADSEVSADPTVTAEGSVASSGAADDGEAGNGGAAGVSAGVTAEVTTATGPEADSGRPSRRQRLEQEGEIAADYLEELLEIADLDGDLDMDVEGDRATVSVVGADLPQLVGDQGEVLEALQELTRLAVYRETGERSRLMLDVSGHRAGRRTALESRAADVIEQVKSSNERVSMEPMSPFERKVVHDVVAAAGLASESEGAEPRRYVVVLPQ